MEEDLDKIARLVKAKEHPKALGTESEMDWEKYYRQEKKKYALKAYRCMRCEISISDDQYNNYGICKECYKSHPNPTDSVTSDGTKAKEYKCLECGAEINEGESKTLGVCDECWDKAHPKLQPTESQDELFDIVRLRLWQIGELVPVQRDKEYKKLQSEFRIERI